MDGAVERVRPKMMTVAAIMAGLLPIMWSHGTGAEVMQRIAVPMIGGMVSSTVLTLVVIPGDLRAGQGLFAARARGGAASRSPGARRMTIAAARAFVRRARLAAPALDFRQLGVRPFGHDVATAKIDRPGLAVDGEPGRPP